MNNKHNFIAIATLTAGLLSAGLAQAASDTFSPAKADMDKLCKGCSYVTNVHTEMRQGKTSGVGVVGGAVVGGLLGNRFGGGSGRALMTAGGAVAGGYAGNEIEKNNKKYTVWVVRMVGKDGVAHSREQSSNPNLRAGDTVVYENGAFVRR